MAQEYENKINIVVPYKLTRKQVEETFERIIQKVPEFPRREKIEEIYNSTNSIENLVKQLFFEGIRTTSKDIAEKKVIPIDIQNYYNFLVQTSGTSGIPKAFPYTPEGDGVLLYEQVNDVVSRYLKGGEKIHCALAPLPSISGEFARQWIEKRYRIDGVPYQLIMIPGTFLQPQNFQLLINWLSRNPPEVLFGLTTYVINIAKILPRNLRENIRVMIFGGEEFPRSLSNELFEKLPNLEVLIDVYGASEFGIPALAPITKNNINPPFELGTSILVGLTENREQKNNEIIARLFVTKLEPLLYEKLGKKDPLGIYLIHHDIGDLIYFKNGQIYRFFRGDDQISLSAAKLYIPQVREIAHQYSGIEDIIVIYKYAPEQRDVKGYVEIRLGYNNKILNQEEASKIAKEVESKIFELNPPIAYEVNVTKTYDLKVTAVPIERLRENLPPSTSLKPKRLYRL